MAYYPYATVTDDRYVLTNTAAGVVAVFNDPASPLYAGMLSEISGLDSPEVRESAEELAQADGGSHGAFYFGRRPITMTAKFFGHTSLAQRTARMDLARRASLAMRSDATLAWKPSTRNENFITNPRAQNNTTGWVTSVAGVNSGAALTRQTGQTPPVGTTAIQVATTGSGNANQGYAIPMTVEAGKTYTYSISARRSAGTGSGELFLNGPTNSTITATVNGSSWVTYTGSFTPGTSGTQYIGIKHPASNTNASTFQVSDVMIAGGTNTNYRDGDTSGWFWQGDEGNSASGDFLEMFTYVRRQGPIRESGGWVKDMQISLVSEFAAMYSVGQKTTSALAGANLFPENRGSWPAYPTFKIHGPISVTNPSISQVQGGSAQINTTGSLLIASGEDLEIDTLNHTATFTVGPRTAGGTGNANSFINFATTIWPTIPTGTSGFNVNGSSGSMEATWRDTWM